MDEMTSSPRRRKSMTSWQRLAAVGAALVVGTAGSLAVSTPAQAYVPCSSTATQTLRTTAIDYYDGVPNYHISGSIKVEALVDSRSPEFCGQLRAVATMIMPSPGPTVNFTARILEQGSNRSAESGQLTVGPGQSKTATSPWLVASCGEGWYHVKSPQQYWASGTSDYVCRF